MTRRESSLALFFLFFLSVFSFFSFIWHLLWLVTSRFNYRRLGFGVFKVGRAADSNLNFPIISLFSDSLTPFVPYYSSKSPPLQRLESSNSLSFFSPSFLPFFLSLFLPSFLSLSLSLLPIHCIQSPRYSSNPQGYRNRGEKERERKKERKKKRERERERTQQSTRNVRADNHSPASVDLRLHLRLFSEFAVPKLSQSIFIILPSV